MTNCPICSGTLHLSRTYEGFDHVPINEWVCDGCGRVVKVASKKAEEKL